jgi:outer membrane protein OmpA-like peptidoglycan-associated protein
MRRERNSLFPIWEMRCPRQRLRLERIMTRLTMKLAAVSAGALILAACQTAYQPRPLAGAALSRSDRQEAQLRDSLRDSGVSVTRERRGFLLDVPQEVLFPFNSAELRPQARDIIHSLVANVLRFENMRVGVYGFTDTAGREDYNRRLSEARANAVARELTRNGIDRERIITYGFGEENLRVPPADGVREPANRRVEIYLEPLTG